jgi:GNAT superfamily N-acetyltransferase
MVKHDAFHYEWDNMDDEIKIRPYWEGDRQEVFRIAADTAFFGGPVEAFLDDRRLFCDAFVRYYADYEADYVWVVCMDDQVVGYLTGCVDTAAQRKRYLIRTIAPLVGRVFLGKYKLGSKTWRFTRSLLSGVMRKEYPHINYEEYPAHLHINVDVSNRGQGLGQKLMGAYLNQLRQLGVPGVFLGTTNLNEAACRLYEKTGFKLLDTRQTWIWSYLVEKFVENRSYGIKLVDS